jgi:hypothetical protein
MEIGGEKINQHLARYTRRKGCTIYAREAKRLSNTSGFFYRLFVIPGLGHSASDPGVWKIGKGAVSVTLTNGLYKTDHSVSLRLVESKVNRRPKLLLAPTTRVGKGNIVCGQVQRVFGMESIGSASSMILDP